MVQTIIEHCHKQEPFCRDREQQLSVTLIYRCRVHERKRERKRERERERERETETDRQTDRQRERERERTRVLQIVF